MFGTLRAGQGFHNSKCILQIEIYQEQTYNRDARYIEAQRKTLRAETTFGTIFEPESANRALRAH